MYHLLQKMGWATLWAILSQTHLVTLSLTFQTASVLCSDSSHKTKGHICPAQQPFIWIAGSPGRLGDKKRKRKKKTKKTVSVQLCKKRREKTVNSYPNCFSNLKGDLKNGGLIFYSIRISNI
jgi:hypothetical protein